MAAGLPRGFDRIVCHLKGLVPYGIYRAYHARQDRLVQASRQKALLAQLVPPGALVFDIGSNLGNRIDAFLSRGARVVAVEPHPDCGRRLEQIYGERITLIKAAVGAAAGRLPLHIGKMSHLSTLSPGYMAASKESKRFGGRCCDAHLTPEGAMARVSDRRQTMSAPAKSTPTVQSAAVMSMLLALSFSHLLNDTIQSLLPAIYPVLKQSYGFNYSQIGLITFAFQMTGSILQPVVGFYTDRRPKPYSLAVGMGITLSGLVLLSQADRLPLILLAAAMVGMGSAIFHPEASRLARLASGGQHGFAQSLFQVGGNLGSSLGPALAALVVAPHGQHSILWFSAIAVLGIFVLLRLGAWYHAHLNDPVAQAAKHQEKRASFAHRRIIGTLAVLVILIFSKYIYLVSLSNYYTFYLIDRFHLSVPASQWALFVFLFAVAAGTIIGGPVGDRIGRKRVIWISILGVAPFSLALPYASLPMTIVLTVFIGVILASAFSAILVYAQELVPGNVGLIAGLFFGLAFGVAGIGSALLGRLADHTSINHVFKVCAFLPLLGLLTAFLPEVEPRRGKAA